MKLVDTHQHLWNPDRIPCSWTAGIPTLNRRFEIEDYLAASEGSGIEKAVFMECDVDEPHALDEARHVQSLSARHPLISAIVASGRPGVSGFRRHLEALSDLSKVRGLRRVLHNQPDAHSRQASFRRDLRLLPEFDFTFDLCVLARQLPVAIELVEACPEVTFILDHCGIPDVKGKAFDPWRQQIEAIATHPNVVACKISGLVAYAEPTSWSVDDLRPWFDHAIASFGWDRVVWGGDWPVCTLSASLLEWVQATHTLTTDASPEQRARLYHLNAERIYRV